MIYKTVETPVGVTIINNNPPQGGFLVLLTSQLCPQHLFETLDDPLANLGSFLVLLTSQLCPQHLFETLDDPLANLGSFLVIHGVIPSLVSKVECEALFPYA